MQVPKIRGCALSWWLVAALMVCQLKLSEASDCSATAVAKDGSRDARSVCSSSQFDSILTPSIVKKPALAPSAMDSGRSWTLYRENIIAFSAWSATFLTLTGLPSF